MGGERLDTRNPTSKLILTILAGVATWEREIMLERQRESVAKAKAEGKYKGRPDSRDQRGGGPEAWPSGIRSDGLQVEVTSRNVDTAAVQRALMTATSSDPG
jgi:DNA invertase Pin-like site-specific DNA recombinase